MRHPSQHAFGVESHLAALDSRQWSELERVVESFEDAWRRGRTPALAEYVPREGTDRTAVLLELAATDLEFRWRRGLATTAEDYLTQFPELSGNSDAIVHLAVCEFTARRRAGSAADPAEFLRRFPDVAEELRTAFAEASGAAACHAKGADVSSHDNAHDVVPDAAHDVPRRVGRYDLVRRIGGGSFGIVYEAIDSDLRRRVAVKLPRQALDSRSEERTRFVREAQNLARLSHAAIVPVLDAGWSDGSFYIVCSLVEGPTLAERLRDGPLPPRAAAQIIATIADALDHAHHQGIVHRDVKPSNILFDADFSPWLTDFGLAGRRDAEATLTIEGQLLGTPAYMAPEQAAGGAHQLDGRADVYSLGAVLYECLTGQLPFLGSPSAIFDQIRFCDPLPPTRLRARIDRDLELICLAALEKRPADRYPSAAALADDLRRYLAGEPIHARPPGAVRRLVKWARRRPAVAALAGLALGAILVVTVLVWRHNVQLRGALIQTDEALQQAEMLRLSSEQSQRRTESLLYAADMRLANNSYVNGDRIETVSRLRKYLPAAAGPDRREFAWRRLWSLCHADQQVLVGHAGDVYVAQVVGDGRQLVSAGRDGTLRLWNLSDNNRVEILGKYAAELNFAAVAPDGITLATGDDGGTIRLWSLAEGRETGHFVGHGNWALCGAISPRGDQLATSGRDNVIRLWTLPRGELVAELPGHTSTVESLAYLPDGKSLVSTGADCTLRLWDLAAKSGSVLAMHPAPMYGVACSHDGRRLATACVDHNVYLWDVETRGMCGRLNGHTEVVQSVAFSPDDMRLASASADGTVRVWDLQKLTQLELFLAHTSRVWSVAWFPDGAALASAGADGTVRLWRSSASRLGRVSSLPTEVNHVCFSTREGRVWASAKKGCIWVWDAEGSPSLLAAPAERFGDVAAARNADVLAVKTADYQVQLFDGGGRPLSSSIELPVHIGLFALSPGGDLLAVSGLKGDLHLYELPTFRLRWSRAVYSSSVQSVEFTRQGDELIAAGGDGFVAEVNVSDGAMHAGFRPRQAYRVTTSPNGRLLAAGCSDRAIRIWDREQGAELTCLQGHDGEVAALAFSPDGQTLAAGTWAGSVTLWHVPSWQELGTFKTSLAAINDLAFSPAGLALAIGGRTDGGGGQVILWETKTVDD